MRVNINKMKSKSLNITQANHVIHKDKKKEMSKKKCRKKINIL
jgi:hypothetical protein